jgi:hypothetical protein
LDARLNYDAEGLLMTAGQSIRDTPKTLEQVVRLSPVVGTPVYHYTEYLGTLMKVIHNSTGALVLVEDDEGRVHQYTVRTTA